MGQALSRVMCDFHDLRSTRFHMNSASSSARALDQRLERQTAERRKSFGTYSKKFVSVGVLTEFSVLV
jgi:hypothetical protein